MKKFCIWLLIGCALAQTGFCATAERTLVHNEITRSYSIHVPESYDSSSETSLVFCLHGYGDDADWMEQTSGMSILADRDGFIVLYPEGMPLGTGHERMWNWGEAYEAGSGVVDDANFISTLMDIMLEEYSINVDKVYVLGWSNGAFFTHHLGATMPEKIAAIAPCAGLLAYNDLTPGPLISVITFHGEDDGAVPYTGYPDSGYPGAEEGAALWAQRNNCNMVPEIIRDDTRVLAQKWSAPAGAGDVVFYKLKNWGHRIANDDEVWLAEIVWEFFKSHPKMGPEQAWNPKPADDEQNVNLFVGKLDWSPGEVLYQPYRIHNLYFGMSFDDVNTAMVPLDTLTDTSEYTIPPLEYNTTYYWRVDEVNDLGPDDVVKGAVWRFSTRNYLIVDDFETYTDIEPNRVFDAWIDGRGIETNGSMVGYPDPDVAAGEHFVETEVVYDGDQSMPFFYNNSVGISEATKTINADWTQDDVNALSLRFKGIAGTRSSFKEEPAGIYTIDATGRDIYDIADEFHFAYKELTDNTTIIAKVESLENVDPWAKAGVMIRDTLEANARYAGIFITPENGGRFQYRAIAGNYTETESLEGLAPPYWIKLERSASGLVMVYYAEDGENWARILQLVSMTMPVYAGLAVTSHNTEAVCEAVFSNVTITGTGSDQPWTSQDIGIVFNDPQPLYVVLNDTAVVYYDEPRTSVIDPNASLIDKWTEWRIPLQAFEDEGVDLTNVNSMGIGLGNRDNPQLGGAGTIFFDAIWLYRP